MRKRVLISAAAAVLILFAGCEKRESETAGSGVETAAKSQSAPQAAEADEKRAVQESAAVSEEAPPKAESAEQESPVAEKVTEAAEEVKRKASEITETVKEEAKAAAAAVTGAVGKKEGVDAAALYKSKCAGCHGAKGEKHALGKSNVIAGQPKALLIQKLDGYKEGSYGGAMKSIMKSQVGSLDEEQIEALSGYISTLK